MKAIELLELQHEEAFRLLATLLEQTGSLESRRARLRDVAETLLAHAELEELYFYPAVRAADADHTLRHSLLEEHLAMKRLLADLWLHGIPDATFERKLRALHDETVAHVDEERRELFPRVRQLLTPDDEEALGQHMAAVLLAEGRPTALASAAPLSFPAAPLDDAPDPTLTARVLARVVSLAGLALSWRPWRLASWRPFRLASRLLPQRWARRVRAAPSTRHTRHSGRSWAPIDR